VACWINCCVSACTSWSQNSGQRPLGPVSAKKSLLLGTRNHSWDDCAKCRDHMSVTSKSMPCRCTGFSRRRHRHHWGWHFTDWRGSAGGRFSRTSGHRNRRWNRWVWQASPEDTWYDIFDMQLILGGCGFLVHGPRIQDGTLIVFYLEYVKLGFCHCAHPELASGHEITSIRKICPVS